VARDGATLAPSAFALRYTHRDGAERLLIVNFGADCSLPALNEPLLAPPRGASVWEMLWSSERLAYGGSGPVRFVDCYPWMIPAGSATLLAATRQIRPRRPEPDPV
jgi:maltooligosyltrehalose trehalohydrolase